MVDNKNNDRLSHALEWCREHKVKARLDLFNRKRKKKLGKKEFKEMCKKAGVKKGSLSSGPRKISLGGCRNVKT